MERKPFKTEPFHAPDRGEHNPWQRFLERAESALSPTASEAAADLVSQIEAARAALDAAESSD